MKVTVEIKRAAGFGRLSEQFTPLIARIGTAGDLLADVRFTDVECAKEFVQARLDERFRQAVEIAWVEK